LCSIDVREQSPRHPQLLGKSRFTFHSFAESSSCQDSVVKRPLNAERVVLLRSWRRLGSWSGAPGPLSARLRAGGTSRFAREGGLDRGAGLLARWPRSFARSGRLASLVKAACIVERGSWPAVRAALSGVDVSLRSRRRLGGPPHVVTYVQCPTHRALRTVTPRCAREGGPEDRPTYRALRTVQCPTYSALRTVPYVQFPRHSDVSLRSRRRPGGPPHVTLRILPYAQCPRHSDASLRSRRRPGPNWSS
jgi:hypothetical protein